MNFAIARTIGVVVAMAFTQACALGTGEQTDTLPDDAVGQEQDAVPIAPDQRATAIGDVSVAPMTAASLVELPPVKELPEDMSLADPSAYRAIEELSPEELARVRAEETTVVRATGRVTALPRTVLEGK